MAHEQTFLANAMTLKAFFTILMLLMPLLTFFKTLDIINSVQRIVALIRALQLRVCHRFLHTLDATFSMYWDANRKISILL